MRAYDRVERESRLARYGCDCYAYCMLAAGHIDLVIEAGLKPYDIVALIPIIEGAGGIVTTWDGGSAAKGGSHRRRRRPPRPRGRARAAQPVNQSARSVDALIRRARDEGVEGGPELLADRVALHQDLVARRPG